MVLSTLVSRGANFLVSFFLLCTSVFSSRAMYCFLSKLYVTKVRLENDPVTMSKTNFDCVGSHYNFMIHFIIQEWIVSAFVWLNFEF